MKKRLLTFILVYIIILTVPSSALASDYYFRLDKETVHVYWNDDGTISIDYQLDFYNDPSGHAIEYVDLGLPNYYFDTNSISAEVDGKPLKISESDYEGSGSGVALVLGSNAIKPGKSGTVHVYVGTVRNMLYQDDDDSGYASGVFSPFWFGSSYVYGSTDMTVTFHLPPGVTPEEPRWHKSPSGGWPSEPVASIDPEGRITYTWYNANANGHTQYKFGASFPNTYVPAGTIATPSFWERTGIDPDMIMGFSCFAGIFGFIALIAWLSALSNKRRKMKYLPPKIRIEGHGIKRGLTAIEAAILMEQPMDKVLTMILFAVIKKDAAEVVSRDPLKLKINDTIPKNLHNYEKQFLVAFKEGSARSRRKHLQNLMVALIKSVGKKMKGFSHKESVAYYQKIMERAWQEVEAANTPEVRSKKYDEHMGWTMLDKDFDDRTRDVFRTGPVYVPVWWHRYDPGWSQTVKSSPKVSPTSSGGGRSAPSMPNLPGGEFAASVATGVQGFASNVVGNVTDFTSGVTRKTNPIPKSTSRSSGWSSGGSSGGSSCACACACAGCACACAGGGR